MKTTGIYFSLWLALGLTACSKDENTPEPVNEEELITTVQLHFTSSTDSTDTAVFSYTDLDGDGPLAPVIQDVILQDQSDYFLTVSFLNETETPAEDISLEVKEEGTEHQLFFIPEAGLGITISYDDTDTQGNPIGLQNRVQTGMGGSGNLRIVLRHQPNKNAALVKEGLITNAGGETDVEVNFPLSIQ